MQISQLPQVLLQPATCVHGLHRFGFESTFSVHVPLSLPSSEPSQTPHVAPTGQFGIAAMPGMTQQPKQSQPFGVNGPQ